VNFKTFKKGIVLGVALLAICALSVPAALAKNDKPKKDKKVTHAQRKAAAARAFQQGALNPLMVEMQAAALINGAPHYFSHPNYANSPLPTVEGTVIYFGNELIDRTYASDFPVGVGELAPVFVVVPTVLPDGLLTSFQTWNQATPGGSPNGRPKRGRCASASPRSPPQAPRCRARSRPPIHQAFPPPGR